MLHLCYQDSDLLIYDIAIKDIYKDIKEWFDFSDCPKTIICTTRATKKMIGKFKDELNGKQITVFVGLRPKQYAFKVENGEEKKNITKTPKVCMVLVPQQNSPQRTMHDPATKTSNLHNQIK